MLYFLRIFALLSFLAGLLFLAFGILQTHSFYEWFLRKAIGRYSEETMAYLFGGSLLIIVSMSLFFTRKKII
jgi:Protein of unknown function (DUF3185)